MKRAINQATKYKYTKLTTQAELNYSTNTQLAPQLKTKLIQMSLLALTAFFIALYLIAIPAMATSGFTWQHKANNLPAPHNWTSVVYSANNTKLFATDDSGVYTSTDFGATWTRLADLGFNSLASSADGTKLAAVGGDGYSEGDIYTSTDSGVTWTKQTIAGSHVWSSIASSADGTKLAAVGGDGGVGGDIYTSTDSGSTWTKQTDAGHRQWSSITSSADGSKLAATDNMYSSSGDIYTSTDYGATWTDQTAAGARGWTSIASSADGSKLAATDNTHGGGNVYTSTDSGATWTKRTIAGSYWGFGAVASSLDGTKLVAASYPGNIFTSTDSGSTWTKQVDAGMYYYTSVASSADGSKLAAVVENGDIYTSTDSGATWTDQTDAGSHNWQSITSSADGSKLAAVVGNGDIYTGTDPALTKPNTTSFQNATNKDSITLTTPADIQLSCHDASSASSLPTDTGNSYPLGLVNFCLTVPDNSSQAVSLTFATNLKPNQVTPRKYNPTTKAYTDLPDSANATVTTTTLNSKPALKLTYQITDNGPLDTDPTLGSIKDPVGLATKQQPASNSSANDDKLPDTGENDARIIAIATITIIAALIVAGHGVYRLKRKHA